MENEQVRQSVGPDGEGVEVSIGVDEAVSSLIVKGSLETVGLCSLDRDQRLGRLRNTVNTAEEDSWVRDSAS
eukprot:756345-Rhodomonas_salina.1